MSNGLLREILMAALLTLIIFFNITNQSLAGMLNIEGEGGQRLFSSEKSREIEVYGLLENFVWQEITSGTKILEENGMLYGIGFAGKLFYPSNETLSTRGELFLGNVNYDGAIQTGAKATSITDYLGLKLEADRGFYKGVSNGASIEPYVGAGYRRWKRQLNDGKTSTGVTARGYTEQWQTFYLRTGVLGEIIKGNNITVFSSIGLNIPVFTTNSVSLSEIDTSLPDITLNPGSQISFNADAGIKKNRFQFLLFYEQMRFAKSDNVSIGGGLYFFQPESKADIIGVRVGVDM